MLKITSQIQLLLLSLILLGLLAQQTQQQSNNQPLKLIKITDYPEAKCLDGSPPSIYWREGTGENKDKFIFYFQGGGWCAGLTKEKTIQDCVKRSKTLLGTSNLFPENFNFLGIFNQNQNKNPHFYNYSHILVNYCDGTGHQGYREKSVGYESESIWFRGGKNTEAAIQYALEKLNMKNASQVIVSGSSAGGLACFTWIDFISNIFKQQQYKNSNTQVIGACDSGVFLDFTNMNNHIQDYQIRIENFMYFSNSETAPVNQACAQAYPEEQWKCMLAQYLVNFINTRTLIIQSEYDSWSIENIIGAKCLQLYKINLDQCNDNQLQQIDQYRSELLNTMRNSIQQNSNLSVWGISCVIHTFLLGLEYNNQNWEVPENSGWTVDKAIYEFQSGVNVQQYDNLPWPGNTNCSNTKNNLINY